MSLFAERAVAWNNRGPERSAKVIAVSVRPIDTVIDGDVVPHGKRLHCARNVRADAWKQPTSVLERNGTKSLLQLRIIHLAGDRSGARGTEITAQPARSLLRRIFALLRSG
jgi:hypothetical protein